MCLKSALMNQLHSQVESPDFKNKETKKTVKAFPFSAN